MKWFGVDYRYVIAGVSAVFILAYEFIGNKSEEVKTDKQEAQNSKALSVEALNEKLSCALALSPHPSKAQKPLSWAKTKSPKSTFA